MFSCPITPARAGFCSIQRIDSQLSGFESSLFHLYGIPDARSLVGAASRVQTAPMNRKKRASVGVVILLPSRNPISYETSRSRSSPLSVPVGQARERLGPVVSAGKVSHRAVSLPERYDKPSSEPSPGLNSGLIHQSPGAFAGVQDRPPVQAAVRNDLM